MIRFCDVLGMIFFVLLSVEYWRRSRKLTKEMEKEAVTVSDYTISVKGFPD